MKKTIMTVLVVSTSLLPLAKGQVPTGAGAPIVYAAPPAGFNPVTASDAQLAQYGFPPRPDLSVPDLYAHWVRMVTAPQTRLTNVTVQTTNVVNGSIGGRQDKGTVGNVTATQSNNWSGYAIASPSGTFRVSDSFVFAEWDVPAAGVDNCSYAPYAASQWVGLDGFSNLDVLQAGTTVTACPATYSAWYEWYTYHCTVNSTTYPCYQNTLSLAISPGDYIATEVWYTTSAPEGHAYMLNYTTQQSVSVAFNQPPSSASGTGYSGNSAEWIVERPSLISGTTVTLENLADYISVPMSVAYAYNGSYFYPSSAPSGSSIYNITMTCPPWNPSSACPSTEGLSWVSNPGSWFLDFYDEGPAYQ
jgi:hypothetical protein